MPELTTMNLKIYVNKQTIRSWSYGLMKFVDLNTFMCTFKRAQTT